MSNIIQKKSSSSFFQKLIPMFVLLPIVIISIIAYFLSAKSIQTSKIKTFNSEAEISFNAIQREIDILVTTLQSLQTYVYIHPNLSRINFRNYVLPALERNKGIIAMGFEPVLSDAQLPIYLKRAHKDGIQRFHFYEKTAAGSAGIIIPIKPRKYHIPIYYIEPLNDGNAKILGFDSGSDPLRVPILLQSIQTNGAGVTGLVHLLQGGGGSIIFFPIYKKHFVAFDKLGFDDVSSFIYGAISYKYFIQKAIGTSNTQNIHLYDQDAKPDSQLLYGASDLIRNHSTYPLKTLSDAAKVTFSTQRIIKIGSRHWVLWATPSENVFNTGWIPRIILMVGFLFAILFFIISKIIVKNFQQKISIDELELTVSDRTKELNTQNNKLSMTLIDLQKTQAERLEIQKKADALNEQLIIAARLAGMAEIATNVLHSLGNTLNSVSTSISLLKEKVANSKMKGLTPISSLIKEHDKDINHFITQTERGKLIPEYIVKLSDHWESEKINFLSELKSLESNVMNAQHVIANQNTVSNTLEMQSEVSLPELIDDTLLLNKVENKGAPVEIIRDFIPLKIKIDKLKALQIIASLLKNSFESLNMSNIKNKKLLLSIEKDGAKAYIHVEDNGVGITTENAGNIFKHGYTTKKGSYGFSLHMCILSAREMGGDLKFESAGEGKGAKFSFELPIEGESEIAAVHIN